MIIIKKSLFLKLEIWPTHMACSRSIDTFHGCVLFRYQRSLLDERERKDKRAMEDKREDAPDSCK